MGTKFPAQQALYAPAQSLPDEPIIIVGNGPAGVHLLKELKRLGVDRPIIQFGREQSQPYDRVALSNLLQGKVTADSLLASLGDFSNVNFQSGNAIVSIQTDLRTVTDQQGLSYPYGALVLALGSRPHVPGIPGRKLSGVFTFRSINDVERLRSRHFRSRHCVVLGGGLLGIEAARGMLRYGTKVTVIHHAPFLMNRQLEPQSGDRLRHELEDKGLKVLLNSTITDILGHDRVEQVRLRGGEILDCDTVIFSTGIRPNIELARHAGIVVGQGIQINDQLQTSAPDVYAIGECSEHRGEIYGLVSPGLEQAAVLASRLSGANVCYQGSALASSLKVSDIPVNSAGTVSEYGPALIDCTLRHASDQHSRAITLYRGKLVGAAGTGEWPEFHRLQEAISKQLPVYPWQRRRFVRDGRLYTDDQILPDSAILCNCRRLTAGEIRGHMQEGMTTRQLCEASGAAQVCGSCEPLVARVAASPVEAKPISSFPLIAGLIALAYALLFYLVPPFPIQQSVLEPAWPKLWTSNVARQWTGYTLLSLIALGMVVSLAKRGPQGLLKRFKLARNAHLLLTLLMASVLLVHTGLQQSTNLNFALLSCAIALITLGGVTSIMVALEPRIQSLAFKSWKRRLASLHLFLAWPLPVLLGFHIVSVYYF
ncbi:NAD(P)/FAD-dependent oxidoreductase [Marinobacter salinisoli]|uniref:NAD(P)/FAD-dependent oxidoreductase n=1 Tax=Marinobacter salinisoli TaxID=2769486 RepID=A0ABX7MP37_9GAMM|nr:FAD-dependent oxidoreductase [Marinobacter salinisoli]QSP94062.1 NAD(P)/FAD-dependent oxidoreductase [Marinobacter salinisoli]